MENLIPLVPAALKIAGRALAAIARLLWAIIADTATRAVPSDDKQLAGLFFIILLICGIALCIAQIGVFG
jgi:hypothetical protein